MHFIFKRFIKYITFITKFDGILIRFNIKNFNILIYIFLLIKY